MAIEFALAVASGLIVALVSTVLQRRTAPPDSTLEVKTRVEVVIQSNTFIDGIIVQQESEAYIEESTFRLPLTRSATQDPRLPVAAGLVIFVVAIAALLLI